MTTLRTRVGLRYALVVSCGLLVLGWLVHHEFIVEPELFRKYGIPEHETNATGELAEVVLYGSIPLSFLLGWLLVRNSLSPIQNLAEAVERFHPGNLGMRLPRTQNGDEVDRLSAAFNSMASQVEKGFQQVREFTLNASHELNTPLTLMRAQLEHALAQCPPGDSPHREWLHQQLDEVQRLGAIVESLSFLSRADAGLVRMERQQVRLHELVEECEEDTRILSESDAIAVSSEVVQVSVVGDRHRLRQLFLILADNAVKYNHPSGSIALRLSQAGEQVVFAITNTGPGLNTEFQTRVFDRFVRGPHPAARRVEGSGLGLSIARWIVDAHGGTIKVDSKPEGPTTFTVTLPLAAESERHSTHAPHPSRPGPPA